MSTRFFASVRRNQRQWMVVVTVLSMVSFLFLDDFGRGKGPMSAFGGALMIGTLCAAGMCIVGYPRQKTAEYGAGGFVVGFIAGFVGFGSVGANRPIVRTAVGNFTRADFQELATQRQKVNHFMSAAAQKAHNPQAMGFGGMDDQSMVTYRMLLADAKKMGVQITDERVNQFLKQLNLTKQDFKDCLREARLGEGELFDLLKSELSAQLAVELMRAPAYVPPIPPGLDRLIAQYSNESPDSWRYMQETPQQLWQTFQKLTVKEKLQAVAIPVRDFVSKVKDPSEPEVEAFFDRYKNSRWTDESRPGFAQMPRVQLAYVTGNFEKFEAGADPTDEEVEAYYEKNKDRYRAPLAKDKESTAPKLPEGEADAQKPDQPADGAEKSDDAKKPTDPEKKADEKKVDPAAEVDGKKPAADGVKDSSTEKDGATEKKNKNKDGEEDKKPDGADGKTTAEPKSNCGEEGAAAATSAAKQADDPKPADEKPEAKVDLPAAPADADEPANVQSGSSMPKLSDSPESLPAPQYRELNQELRLNIRDEILKERAFTRIAAEVDKAYDVMDNLRLEYDTLTDVAKKKEMAKTIAEKLKAYAHDHNLEYKETPELTYEELSTEPIGNAFEGKSRSPVVNEVFMPGARGEPRMSVYSPRHAEQRFQGGAFAYWKIAELPAQVSNPKDEAVRERIVSAWKFDQARSLAEERAKELVAKVKADGNDLPAALSGESVTGVKTDPPVTIIPTDEFSWLTTNKSVPNASQGPMITAIPLIPNIADDFMKTVFDDLGEGETGVAVDEPRSIFYVVKVIDREATKNDDGGVAKREQHERFMQTDFASKAFPIIKSPYQLMARYPQLLIEQAWRRNFEQQHQVVWEEETATNRSPK